MARTLNIHVYIEGPDGQTVCLAPGEPLPTWAYEKITNPYVWNDDVPDLPQQADTADSDPPPGLLAGEVEEPSDPDGGSEAPGSAPPKSGKGSGRDAWAEYAEALGVTVDHDANRDDIIAALAEAGHLTE
jgi:hypothetical protein